MIGSTPAVLFRASRDRSGDHPEEHLRVFAGILQADAYAGYNRLLATDRQPGPILEALCWAHARRKFFVLADVAANTRRGAKVAPISPIALEPVPKGLSDWGTRDSKGLFRPSWSERCGPQPLAGSIVARDFDMKRI